MSVGFVVLNVIGLLLLASVLFWMNRKHISFSKRVFTGLGLGVLYGVVLHVVYGPESQALVDSVPWFNIIGTGYIKLLQMIVVPLVFISILTAFTKVAAGKKFGKQAAVILGMLIGTTAIAALIGIGSALLFGLDANQIVQGEAEAERGVTIEETATTVADKTLPDQLLDLLPANPFLDFTGARPTSTIGVVIFAAFLGFAFLAIRRKQPEQAEVVQKGIDALYSLIMAVVKMVLRLTPYGILAIMARTVAVSDYGAIVNLGKFVGASYAALIVMFAVHLAIIAMTGLNPLIYVKKAGDALLFAFSSRSSAGTLPLTLNAQTARLGIPEGIANFAGSFGLSIGQNGCAGIYPAMLAVMIAPTVGQPIDVPFILTLIAIVAISSFGVAGVGGGATFAAILVLSAMNLPIALAGILISVEPLIDMGRTALNVSGSMTAGLTAARVTGELDTAHYGEAMTTDSPTTEL